MDRSPPEFAARALDDAVRQYDGFRRAHTDPTMIPRSASGDSVRLVSPEDWTCGFVAGSFWCLFEHTLDPSWQRAAETWTRALEPQCRRTRDHDIGFIIHNTFGRAQRLLPGDDHRRALHGAAAALSSRFDPRVGAIRSWDFGAYRYPVIIDNLMNLELLFSAAKLGGNPRWAEIAMAHALTSIDQHFRPDGSTFHVVDFDPQTGRVLRKQTNQGLADDSTWARGQAWAIYGCTMLWRETGDPRFEAQARRSADFFLEHAALPADGIPLFDFDAPNLAPGALYRDASAGAIAASALIELSSRVSGDAARRYRAYALRALSALASASYRAPVGHHGHFLLMHSVGNYPQRDEVDVAINYADYYYLEALLRCKALV
jgi:unsaturated chondroitin disaccharide hydrolase